MTIINNQSTIIENSKNIDGFDTASTSNEVNDQKPKKGRKFHSLNQSIDYGNNLNNSIIGS